MPSTAPTLRRASLLLAATASVVAPAAAADLDFPDFFSTTGLQLVGSAQSSGTRLRLTPQSNSQTGAAWALARQDVSAPWTSEFVIEMDGTADGMAFVIQNSSTTAIGGDGGSLAYEPIPNSVAIEFDTYANGDKNDPDDNHVAVLTRGTQGNTTNHQTAELGVTSLITDLSDGGTHMIRVEYVPGALRVYVDDVIPSLQVAIDLEQTLSLSGGEAYVGFTAATGGLPQAHYVHSWTFDEDASPATGNAPPLAPDVLSPDPANGAINPATVAFQLSPFQDPDSGAHACTEYELWSAAGPERIWRAVCPGGQGTLVATLSDGTFLGSHAGQTTLDPSSQYVARARVQDDSGDPLSSWSPWGLNEFQTSANAAVPLRIADVVTLPPPSLRYAASGRPVELDASGAPDQVAILSAAGLPLLTIAGRAGAGNEVIGAGPLASPEPVKLRVTAGAAALESNPLDLVLFDGACERRRVTIPALDLAAGQSVEFWLDGGGGTWIAQLGSQIPDLGTIARQHAVGWDVRSGFEVRTVAAGLSMPTNLAFVPDPGDAPDDPFLYVLELYGTIKVVTNDGTVSEYASGLLNYNPLGQFPGAGEQGLGGVVVDPLTGDLYLSLLYDAGGPHYPRVERFTSLDGGRTAATRTTILDMPGEPQGQAHYIAHMELTADRKLLVHMGDGFNAGTARNLNSFRGKILRVNLDGSAPMDNPFYGGASITARDYVYASGVRNPWGGRTRASDGQHYFVENGPATDRFARLVPGRDYLWDGQDADMTNFALFNWAPAVGPVNLAWVELETFGGSGFPASMMDRGFVSEAGPTYAQGATPRGKKISEWRIAPNGSLQAAPVDFVRYDGPGRSSVIGLAAGHDGLYFTDLYNELGSNPIADGGRILAASYIGEEPFVCGQLGAPYCGPAVANSSGAPASLALSGSPNASDADVVMEVRELPPNQFSLPLASLDQGFVPNPGGSAGNLCLGGSIGRFNALITSSGANGAFDVALPIGSFPPPLTQVMAGETWNFQVWFRDFTLIQTSNYTNGVSLTFQ